MFPVSGSVVVFALLAVLLPSGHESATIRDYVDSAAHLVGLDSLVSGKTSEPLPRCCDLPSPPCQVPVVVAVQPSPCPPVEQPPCDPCPIDYEHANAKSHAKMWEVVMKGKALGEKLTNALAAPVVFTNTKISEAASLLPGAMAAKGKILGSVLSAPVQFAAGKSSLIAKGVSGVVVGVPVAIGTGVVAGVAGLMEKVADIGRQEEACLCATGMATDHHPCPASCHSSPGLVAAGSGTEEKFSIEEPVTESVTEAVGGSQIDGQQSVTDSAFTTTEASLSQDNQSMGMPGRVITL